MKRSISPLFLLGIFACHTPPVVKEARIDSVQVIADAAEPLPPPPPPPVPVTDTENEPDEAIGISGDFNGDGVIDSAWRELVKQSPEADEPHIFAVRFNTAAIPSMEHIENRFRLVQEGDLNGDGNPEISLFQSPLHGTVHYMTTWTLRPNGWKRIAGPWMIPTAGEYLDDAQLRDRIQRINDTLYYWQEDVNDDNFRLERKILPLAK